MGVRSVNPLRRGSVNSSASHNRSDQLSDDGTRSDLPRGKSRGLHSGSWESQRTSLMQSALGGPTRARIQRRDSTLVPALTRESGEKWRQAFETASAQLSVMSAKERQQLLREAARERAYVKRSLW